ncbi:Replication factor C small subunit [Candidatus Tiddalikarchaeum anstoanum]|nr:Replication factor C small subunit [Candidatus Tiddalikarchaeum anstoanum]
MDVWTEKYRPRSLKDVVGQQSIIKRLIGFTKSESMPHLLFAGPAGTGKTTCALALANDLYGSNIEQNFLELNASDERGIDTIRNKVKDFARSKALGAAPYKIIFLGESDALTREAQQALRRTMEKYSSSCRFILDCNYSSKIIDPIQSRCVLFKFKPLDKKDVIDFLKKIVVGEKLKADDSVLEEVFNVSGGDLRKAINTLQSASVIGTTISKELVYEVSNLAHPKDIKNCLEIAVSGDFIKARDLLFDTMIKHGLSGIDVIKQVQQEVLNLDKVSAKTKIRLIGVVGDYEFRLVEGSDEYVQLESLLAQFFKAE